MATRQLRDRRDEIAGFVLHSYPYRETSLIVEAFTSDHGRVSMVARGAKRPRSELRGVLQAFQPLALSWAGAAELKTLIKAEWRGGLPLVAGASLLCGFYLNELLLKLLAREDAHPQLYYAYEAALARLAAGEDRGGVLRAFELKLLAELGYALPLTHEAGTGEPIEPATRYHYVFGRGPLREPDVVTGGSRTPFPQVRGATLLALARLDFSAAETASEAKRLMRDVLDHYLETRAILSRRIVRELHALEDEDSASR